MKKRAVKRVGVCAWMLVLMWAATAEAGIVLEFQIRDQNGKGVSGFVVKAVREETRVSRTAVTAEPGTAILRLSGNGLYSVTVWKPDYAACEVRIDVASGERRVMRFSVDSQRKVLHLESESRVLANRSSRWSPHIGVAIGLGTGGYGPRLSTLNETVNPALGLSAQRPSASMGGELQVRFGPHVSVGLGGEVWSSDTSAESTFIVLVGTIPTPAAIEYRSDLSLDFIPVTARVSLPLGRARFSLLGAWMFARGKYMLTETFKLGTNSSGGSSVGNETGFQGDAGYSGAKGDASANAGQTTSRRIAAEASGAAWRWGGEFAYGIGRFLEAYAAGFFVSGRLAEWKTTEFLGLPGTAILVVRDKSGGRRPFETELDGVGVQAGLRGRF